MRNVIAYGVELPYVEVTMELILLTIFELSPPPSFFELAYRAYKAQENRYLVTGKPTAFTEGSMPTPPNYIYEWIVDIYSGETFTVWNPLLGKLSRTLVVYAKAALGMHAIWSTNYTLFLARYIMKAKATNSFHEGVDENGNVDYSVSDKTNAIIISAAWYAIKRSAPLTIEMPQRITLHAGELIELEIKVIHNLHLPVRFYFYAPAGINATIYPGEVTANSTATLRLAADAQATPGQYEVHVVAATLTGNYTRALSLELRPPGYTLTVKAVDSRGRQVPNATVIARDRKALTGRDGVAVLKHINGTVELSVSYRGVTVWGPRALVVKQNEFLVVDCSLYEVHILAVTLDNRPAPDVLVAIVIKGKGLALALTNATGYATFYRVPGGNVTVYAYTRDRVIQLGEWHVEVTGDGEIIDPHIEPPRKGLGPWHLAIEAVLMAAATLQLCLLLARFRLRWMRI